MNTRFTPHMIKGLKSQQTGLLCRVKALGMVDGLGHEGFLVSSYTQSGDLLCKIVIGDEENGTPQVQQMYQVIESEMGNPILAVLARNIQ